VTLRVKQNNKFNQGRMCGDEMFTRINNNDKHSEALLVQTHRRIYSLQVAKMILSIVLIFALCFLPQHVFYLWFYFSSNSRDNYNQTWHTFRIIAFCFSFINSCVNPILLYTFSGTFHKVILSLLSSLSLAELIYSKVPNIGFLQQFNKTLFFCCCKREGKQTDNSRRQTS